MESISNIAHALLELKRAISDELGTDPQIKIGLDPETYDRLIIEGARESQYSSIYKPHEVNQSTLVGCAIVPWIKEKF